MTIIKAAAGNVVTIGSFSGGYPTQTTWGKGLVVPDAGIPLLDYFPATTDPLTIWKNQPSVRKVVSFAARQFASVPWHCFERVTDNDRQRRADSRAESIMGNPEPMISGFNFWNSMATDRMLYDICLAILVNDQLVRIPPNLIRLVSNHFGQPVEVWVATPKGMDDIDVTDVPKILTWGWHSNKAGGVSPMHTLAGILEENLRSVEWRTQQWANSPKMSGVLKRPATVKSWDVEKRDRFLASWKTWKESAATGGTPLLEDGMEYEQLENMSPKDAKDIEGRQLTDQEVASAFHIPPELVGAREGNFGSIEAFRQMLFGPTLGPMISEMQQAVKIGGLIPALDVTPGLYLEMNREAAMSGSFIDQARVMQTMTGAPVLTVADARARLNLPFIPGTDVLIVPMNVTVGGQASPTDSGQQNLGGDNAAPENKETT